MNIALDSPVAVLGYGVEGKAAAAFLKEQGISDITICDENEKVEVPSEFESNLGKDAFDHLTEFKTIIRSPGVHYNIPGILEAKEEGSTVTSMTELTLEVARDRMTAITGSNGKTTTTALVAAIFNRHYEGKVNVGGNDKTPVLSKVMENENPVLLEVSSFQFADLTTSPHIAAILNITPNHLDWHEDLEDYIHAKENIIRHQGGEDWAVLNANDENSAKLSGSEAGRVFWVGKKQGGQWAIWHDGRLIVKWDKNESYLLNEEELNIKTHPDNILFAVAIATLHDIPATTIKEGLKDFTPEEHRLEFVKNVNGVQFYNDSSCTTPESAQVALSQFQGDKLIMLLGGSSKNADFIYLAHDIKNNDVRVYLYGEEGARIKEALEEVDATHLIMAYDESKDFEAIIKAAQSKAEEGDYVVLSPACASFDMFKNAKERGKQFKEIVKKL